MNYKICVIYDQGKEPIVKGVNTWFERVNEGKQDVEVVLTFKGHKEA